MKHKLIALLCLVGISAYAQLPVHHNSVTSDVSKIKGNFDSFNWKWLGFNSQSNNFYIKNGASWVDVDGINVAYKMSQNTGTGVVTYISSTNITVTDSNLYFAIANTNIPPNGTYLFEVFAWTGSTNPSASLAQGKVSVSQSLYQSGDGLFPWPSATNLTDYLTIASAATSYVGSVTWSETTNGASITDGVLDITFSAASGGDITEVAAGTGLDGGAVSGVATVSLNAASIASLLLADAWGTSSGLYYYASNPSNYVTDAQVSANVSVASNTAKVSYSDAGNVILKDGTVAWTDDENGGGQNSTNWASVVVKYLTDNIRIGFPSGYAVLDTSKNLYIAMQDDDGFVSIGAGTFGNMSSSPHITMSSTNYSDVSPDEQGQILYTSIGNGAKHRWYIGSTEVMDMTIAGLYPFASNTYTLGTAALPWSTIYGGTFHGDGSALTGVGTGDVSQAYVDALNTSASATPYVIASGASIAIDPANGWLQSLYVTNPTVTITLVAGATGTVQQVNLSLWAGTNAITFTTNASIVYASTITPPTNDTVTALYYSPLWSTNWSASEL